MTTYRIFPSTNGPSTGTVFSGTYIAGMVFEVTTGGMWFQGYWWWCCNSGQDTTAVKCCLYSATSGGAGVVVPGSVVTSGTLTPGTWNFIPLAAPLQLSIGTPYVACTGGTYSSGFPFTTAQFGNGQPHGTGIVNGPLLAYSSTPDGATVNASPYFLNQGCFSTAGADPTAHFPGTGNGAFNSWVDVLVSDTAPAGFTGTYRIWPNKFDASPTTSGDNASPFTLATEVRLSQSCATSWVWFYSTSGAASLPTWAGVYQAVPGASSGSPVAQNSSPAWRKPDNSAPATAGGGWCKCALAATLPAGNYRVAIYNSGGAGGSWSSRDYGYFLTGAGGSGISWGPVSSPANGSGTTAWIYQPNPGQTPPYTDGSSTEAANGTFSQDDSQGTGVPQYPYLEVHYPVSSGAPVGAIAESFWVDLEVTPAATGTAGITLSATATGRPAFERQLVRLAVAQYFGGTLVTTDAGTCFQGGPLTAYGLGTAYPYTVRGVPDEYYTAGQPDGQNWGCVMSTTKLERVTTRDSYGGATSGWRGRRYAIECEIALICELPHIEVAGAGLDNLIDAMFALIAADRTLGTNGAPNGVQIIQAGEGKGGAGGTGFRDLTEKFEALDAEKGRYAALATVSFEALTMVAS